MNRVTRFLPLLALVSVFIAAAAGASMRPADRENVGKPMLVAPARGQQLVESAVRFAFEVPTGYSRAQVVVSRQAFDPASWTELPANAGLIVRDAGKGALSLADFGIALDHDATLWWTVAIREEGTNRLRFGEVRTIEAMRKFRNVVAPSPYMSAARAGRLTAAELAEQTADLRQGPPRIRMSSGYDFAPSEGVPSLPADLSVTAPNETNSEALESWIVQYSESPGEAELQSLAKAGGAVYCYMSDNAYLVRMSRAARTRVGLERGINWVGEYQPAYRLSALVDRSRADESDYMMLLFPDADLAEAAAAIGLQGAAVVGQSDNGINKLVRFRTTGARLAAIAGLPGVAWVEPVVKNELLNQNAQWVIQTNVSLNRRLWNMGLRGAGQVVMTSDSGIETTHQQFFDAGVAITGFGDYPTHRKVIAYKLGSSNPQVAFGDHAPGAGWHGTHTACTVAGDDSVNGGVSPNDGMAKDAKLYFMDISGPALQNGVDAFADLNDLFLPSYIGNAAGAARLSSNSWGGGTGGAYTLNSQQCDQFMWSHKDYLIQFANGNGGPGLITVGSPATAKNVGSIGGTQNGASPGIYSGSSRGPTLDNRRKPTYVCPGQGVTSAVGTTPTSYLSYTGTSMASPTATGMMALVREYLTEGWYPTGARVASHGFSPSAALMKAIGVNCANSVVTGFTAPDFNVGWGKLKADSALYFAGDLQKLLLVDNTDGLGPGQFLEYQVQVNSTTIPLEVSLVWTDYPGIPAAATELVNNLNLTVTNGVSTYRGNVYSGAFSTTGGSFDNVNVEENVRINNPPVGLWTVRVSGAAVPIGPQPFGLVMTGDVGNGAGLLAIDRAEYGSSSTMEIQVTDGNAGSSVAVNVVSTTEPGGETVTLNNIGDPGIYVGTLQLTPSETANNSGQLSVSNGDAITVSYQDPSPVLTLSTAATVNFDTPAISNVQAAGAGVGKASVTWATDRSSNSKVYYGTTPALELGSVSVGDAVSAHSVQLTGLVPGTTYYYDVESVSLSGALARDDLGGAHYKFTAKGQGDILLVLGSGEYDYLAAWNNALTTLGYEYDTWTGALSDQTPLGDLASGLRSYKAVLWQVGLEQYPGFTLNQRDTVTAYLGGGGRLCVVGHDIAWGMADPTSPYYSLDGAQWVQNTLKTLFGADPTTWSRDSGFVADPISGNYSGASAITYIPFRSGGAGDEISIAPGSGGTGNYTWKNNETSPDNIGFRWLSDTPNGSSSSAFWGGEPSRLVNMYFEWSQMDPPFDNNSAIRRDVLDKTIVWLLGRERPTVAITSPNGGELVNTGSVDVTWSEVVGPGRAISARTLEYSTDGGTSWSLIASGVGASPYSWDLTGIPNTGAARVRIRVTDDGTPAFSASDVGNANFSIQRTGGDSQGPVVVAGSIESAPNPIVRPNPATFSASVSDQLTGAGVVAAAEWSIGAVPAAAGSGNAMTGSFGTTTVAVSASGVTTNLFAGGVQKIWVRGQDGDGNWGPASSLDVQVNGTGIVGVEGTVPTIAFLAQNAPNPFGNSTLIKYGVPARARVELGVYDLQGRLVKRLVADEKAAGNYHADWDRRDESGARVGPGVYWYRLTMNGARLDKRMVVLN